MSVSSDDQLHHFRVQSDQAFLAMQSTADREMGQFLKSYGENAGLNGTVDATWGAYAEVAQAPIATAKKKMGAALKKGAALLDQAAGKGASEALGHSAHDLYNNFGDIGDSVKKDAEIVGREAMGEAEHLLRGATADLGERARKEALTMRDAAKRMMQEERSLKGLKARAQAELQEAKVRIKGELLDAQGDAIEDLEALARAKAGKLQAQGMGAAQKAQKSAGLELDELLGGGNTRV